MVQVRDNGGLNQGGSNGSGKKMAVLNTFWEVESITFFDDLMWK